MLALTVVALLGAADAGVVLEKRSAALPDGGVLACELGTFSVPENRLNAKSRQISIGFARLKASKPTGAPPVFVIPGGPGSSMLDAFTGGSENSRRRLNMFRRYAAAADVVVVDHRGFSERGTMLKLPPTPTIPLDAPNTVEATVTQWKKLAAGAAEANPGADLSGYTVLQYADDIDALREALGYKKLALVATSFGSQTSFAVMKRHPERVERAVLSGVEPLSMAFDSPSHLVTALQRIAFDAEQAPNLKPYLPPGGLFGAMHEILARLRAAPIEVTVDDGGKPVKLKLGVEDFQAALLPGDVETWPAFVLSVYYRHYEGWAKRELANRRDPPFLAMITPLIDSSLGASAERLEQLRTDPATALLGQWNLIPYRDTRSLWPTPDVGDGFRAPLQSPIPVLFINGDFDTSTPVENALAMMPYFPNGRMLVVHREEHATPMRALREHPKVMDQVVEFLQTGKYGDLPSEVTLAPIKYETPDFPAPSAAKP